jgi:hypothetical protein
VHWSKKTTAHEEIIAETKLEDKKLENRDFVRIEISLKDKTKVTRNPDDWQLKVDEERTLPEWFIENQKKAEKTCWKAWEESIQTQLGLNDENKGKLNEILIFLYENASAMLNGNASAMLNGNASAMLKSKTSVAISNAKIFVHKEATIVQTLEVKASEA